MFRRQHHLGAIECTIMRGEASGPRSVRAARSMLPIMRIIAVSKTRPETIPTQCSCGMIGFPRASTCPPSLPPLIRSALQQKAVNLQFTNARKPRPERYSHPYWGAAGPDLLGKTRP
jgi:hypothetical protein